MVGTKTYLLDTFGDGLVANTDGAVDLIISKVIGVVIVVSFSLI